MPCSPGDCRDGALRGVAIVLRDQRFGIASARLQRRIRASAARHLDEGANLLPDRRTWRRSGCLPAVAPRVTIRAEAGSRTLRTTTTVNAEPAEPAERRPPTDHSHEHAALALTASHAAAFAAASRRKKRREHKRPDRIALVFPPFLPPRVSAGIAGRRATRPATAVSAGFGGSAFERRGLRHSTAGRIRLIVPFQGR